MVKYKSKFIFKVYLFYFCLFFENSTLGQDGRRLQISEGGLVLAMQLGNQAVRSDCATLFHLS